MAEDTKITGIYEIRIEQGPALRSFEEVKKRLDNTKAAIRELNKENKQLIQAEKEVTDAIKLQGTATTAQVKQLEAVRARRNEVNKAVSEAVIVEKALSGQARELTNDLSGLTENNLRFRDKMAQATLEAIKQSGVLDQLASKERELSADLNLVAASLQKNEQQLAELNAAYAKGEKTTEEYTKEQADLTRQIEDGKAANTLLKAELDKVSATTATLDQRVHELNQELNAGKITAEEYRKALSKIEDETRKAGAATASLTEKFDGFVGRQGAELKSTLNGIALQYAGIGAAIYGAQRIIGDAIDTVVEFDRALSNIRALGGEYASNIEAIGEAAKTAGINFGFSAKESLDAVEALAKAGVSVTDILGGALPGALTLAAAGEVSVADAAETASKAMTQFGLAGADIPKLADLLAAAAATATGDVGDFNQALNQAGLVAAQLNIPIEEAVGALTAFASAGLLGSDAGTSFRTMLLRLQNPTEESAKLMERYGISAFDAQGNFVGLEAIAGQLQERLGGLTQEQRSATLAQIFGSDAIRAANVLYKEGSDGVKRYTEQVNQIGFAQQVAAEKTNNLKGDLARAGATYDALVLSIDNGSGTISSAFRSITQAVSEALGVILEFNKLSGQKQDFQDTVGAFLTPINKTRDKQDQISSDPGYAQDIFDRYQQQIQAIKDTEDAEQRLQFAIDSRADALKRVRQLEQQLQEQGPTRSGRLEYEIALAKAAVVKSQEIIDAERKQKAAVEATTDATKENTDANNENAKATSGSASASEKSAKETQNVAGSVADLNDQIQKLQQAQAQSTDSAQFQAYQTQLDALKQSIEDITNASATPMIDAAFGPDPFAELPQGDASTPMIDEANAEERLALEQTIQAASLSGYEDYQAQLELLDLDFQEGRLESLKDYNDQRLAIQEAQAQREVAIAADTTAALGQLLTELYTGQIKDEKDFQKQLLVILLDSAKKQIQISIAKAQAQSLAQADSVATFGATGLARAAILQALIEGVFAGLKGLVQGLATGGQVEGPSGVVSQNWGTPVRRRNGDNVLVSTRAGFVTLKTGEVVLNEEQQRRARMEAGDDIFGRIGVPGFRSFSGTTMARHYLAQGYADGGMVGLVTPRPSPSTIVQSQVVSQLAAYTDRPIYTAVTEINDVQNRVTITEQVGTL